MEILLRLGALVGILNQTLGYFPRGGVDGIFFRIGKRPTRSASILLRLAWQVVLFIVQTLRKVHSLQYANV